MNPAGEFLLTIGGILLLGLLTSAIGRRTPLPRVTLLLLFGIVIGRSGFNIIPPVFTDYFDIVADITLVMIGFLLGGKLTLGELRSSGRQVLSISIAAAVVTVVFVSAGLVAVGMATQPAILLGCIAAATAPAAVYDTVKEINAHSVFSKLLLAVVAVDDAWALVMFSLGMALVASLNGSGLAAPLLGVLWELGGGVALGAIIGFPAAVLTGRVKPGEPILSEALGLVFVCGGLAIWLGVSFLIAAITMGSVVATYARHHDYSFHEIENIEALVMVVFFVLAGATLEISALQGLGLVGMAYIASRTLGKFCGSWLGARIGQAPAEVRRWMGLALLPQAGVAIGMALVASTFFPEHRQLLLSIVVSSTVFFELVGPLATRLALKRTLHRQ